MATPKDPDLEKKTMNFRIGDFDKMQELFPNTPASVSIRNLVSVFVDKHYAESEAPTEVPDVNL